MLWPRCQLRMLSRSRSIFYRYHCPLYHIKYTFSTKTNAAILRSIDLKKDYYSILGVTKDANKKEIRKKYFESAKKYHPDVTGKLPQKEQEEANNKFILISQAYEILSSKSKRKVYDEERKKRNLQDPSEIKEDFYKNIMRKAKRKGIDLDKFETEQQAYEWWQHEQHEERQEALKAWRKNVKTRPMSAFEDYHYFELMNKNLLITKEQLVVKNAIVALLCGVGIYTLFLYLTSDSNKTFTEFYMNSALLQQVNNRIWYKHDMVTTTVPKNQSVIDDDGHYVYTEINKRVNPQYEHTIRADMAVPPSFSHKEHTELS